MSSRGERSRVRPALAALTAALALAACGKTTADAPVATPEVDAATGADAFVDADARSDAGDDATPLEPPFSEVIEQGVTRYLGAFVPSEVREADGAKTHVFAPADGIRGPACIRGATYHVATRNTGSPDLLIFMQGGGACWSDFCFTIEEAGADGVPTFDVLDTESDTNPFADWNVLYLPYCDGSLFVGDADYDPNGDGTPDRLHRGLQNLSAALDVAHSEFPGVERVMLAGSSGGGFGTIMGTPIVRAVYPDAELLVFNDAGVGVAKDGDPAFLEGLVDEFNGRAFVPGSCTDCLASGHLTPLVAYTLEQDPTLRIATFSSYRDSVISNIFLSVPGPEFEAVLLRETQALAAACPGRYAPFLIDGKQHTVLLGDIRGFLGDGFDVEGNPFASIVEFASLDGAVVDGVSALEWLNWMLSGDDRWAPIYETSE
jgi:hypothetical protein